MLVCLIFMSFITHLIYTTAHPVAARYASRSLTNSTSRFDKPASSIVCMLQFEDVARHFNTRFGKLRVISKASGADG